MARTEYYNPSAGDPEPRADIYAHPAHQPGWWQVASPVLQLAGDGITFLGKIKRERPAALSGTDNLHCATDAALQRLREQFVVAIRTDRHSDRIPMVG